MEKKIDTIKVDGNEYKLPCKCYLYHREDNTVSNGIIERCEKQVNGYYDPDEDGPDEAWQQLHFSLSVDFFNGMRAGFFYTYGTKFSNLDDINDECIDNWDKKDPIIYLDEKKAYERVIKESNTLITKQNNKIKEYTVKINSIPKK